MLRLSSDSLLGGIFPRALADTFKYFKLWCKTNKTRDAKICPAEYVYSELPATLSVQSFSLISAFQLTFLLIGQTSMALKALWNFKY